MAGSYPDAPSIRMGWDADGSVALYEGATGGGTGPGAGGSSNTPWSTASAGAMISGNDENYNSSYVAYRTDGGTEGHAMFCVIFPETRELDGIYLNIAGPLNQWCYKSQDTTNGIDGSWANAGAAFNTSATLTNYRTAITSMAFSGVKSVKGNVGDTVTNDYSRWRGMHFYGEISPAETPDRILFLDTENGDAEFTKVLDFGDVPRGQTTTRTFKIINNSSSKSINTVQVTAEDLYLNAGGWYEFGDGGGSYQATYSIGNMANGAEELIYMRQVIPGGETLSVQAGRIKVSHASVT